MIHSKSLSDDQVESNHFDQIGLATSPSRLDVYFCAHSRRVQACFAPGVGEESFCRVANTSVCLTLSFTRSLSLTFRKAKRSFCSFCRSAVGCWPFPLMNLSISIRRCNSAQRCMLFSLSLILSLVSTTRGCSSSHVTRKYRHARLTAGRA